MTAAARVDGRKARRDRGAEAVLDAVREMFLEGTLSFTVEAVAQRSGVSLRSVYRYFEDVESLVRAAIARSVAQSEPLWALDGLGEGSFPERVRALVRHRLALYEALAPVARAAQHAAPSQPLIAAQLDARRTQLTEQVRAQFRPEVRALGRSRGAAALAAVDVLLQFEGLEHLHVRRGTRGRAAERVLVQSVAALLEQPLAGG